MQTTEPLTLPDGLVVGDFVTAYFDRDASLASGRFDADTIDEYEWGFMTGQVLKITAREITIQMAAHDQTAKVKIDLENAVSGEARHCVTSLVKTSLNNGHVSEKALREMAEKIVRKEIDRRAKPVIEIKFGSAVKPVKVKERHHFLFPKLMELLALNEHVYIWGPPGWGKSFAAEQAARLLKQPYGYLPLNPQTPESKLFGFNDAHGRFVKTPFYDCWIKGGKFCLDELDNTTPAIPCTLNGALASGLAAFANGMARRHKNFNLVATGNTARGATEMFPDRWAFDAAFADRLFFLHWTPDLEMEREIALGINAAAVTWVDWVQLVRAYCETYHPMVQVTPRLTYRGAKLMAHSSFDLDMIAEGSIFKGLDSDTRKTILRAVPLPKLAVAAAGGR